MSERALSPLRLAAVQLDVRDGAPDANLGGALAWMLEAVHARARLILLPELWSTGYAYAVWERHADQDAPRLLDRLADFCREHAVYAGGSIVERESAGGLVNRFRIFGPDGRCALVYDKTHLFAPMREPELLVAGRQRAALRLDGWRAAASICFDLRFPEMYRADALDGAELFLVASEWPAARADVLRGLAWARAVENQAFLVLCNRTGVADDGERFSGGSMIVAPDGKILAEAGSEPGVILATIDAAPLGLRERIPVLSQRQAGVDTLA